MDAPWPLFRRDAANRGRSPLPADYRGDRPWAFRTGKGIFATPVIDAAGDVYFGSADHCFYALRADGALKWRIETGEIIDSAAALPPPGLLATEPSLVFGSGDGYLYHVRTADGAIIWRFDARVAPRASYNNWWEGNVGIGPDGTLYAGNTNFNYYAIRPDGSLKWTYATGANAWSLAAIGRDGALYWGSNDTFVRRVEGDGRERWRRRTLGFIAASATLGADDTVYIGSFDGVFYALDGRTGRPRWTYRTGDHIYSSAALLADAQGRTTAIFFGSTDGFLYTLDPAGRLLWRYDAGDPIRSSPAVGAAPSGQTGDIVYFGAGNGRLYALDAATGQRRWSFDTTPADPELADRNDLNGSPALGRTGVYIGGEHGEMWYVPYEYGRHAANPRCTASADEDLPAEMAGMRYVTPGGTTLDKGSGEPIVPAAGLITLRLRVRRGGQTVDARLPGGPLDRLAGTWRRMWGRGDAGPIVTAEPPFPFRAEKSADGRYLHVIPDGFLAPGGYRLGVEGAYVTGGPALGNLRLGGRLAGRFTSQVAFRVATPPAAWPLRIDGDETTALEWTRLALPIPTMLPSLNQIGFDYLDWLMAPVYQTAADAAGERRVILWAIGGRRNAGGELVADAGSDFTLPLAGRTRGGAFILENRGFTMKVTGIPIPFHALQLRGELAADRRVGPAASLYAETAVLRIPTFGPYLALAGLASDWYRKLFVTGTYITRPGPAARRPAGLALAEMTFAPPTRRTAGRVTAAFALAPGARHPLAEHRAGILLVDAAQAAPVYLDYHAHLRAAADTAGNLAAVTLALPPGLRLPPRLTAVVICDVFPLAQRTLME
jgi:outer membrane protein assembly factor BamB